MAIDKSTSFVRREPMFLQRCVLCVHAWRNLDMRGLCGAGPLSSSSCSLDGLGRNSRRFQCSFSALTRSCSVFPRKRCPSRPVVAIMGCCLGSAQKVRGVCGLGLFLCAWGLDAGSRLVLRLKRRKNKPAGSSLCRGCWCKEDPDTCPVHGLGPWLGLVPSRERLVPGAVACWA